MLYPVAGSRFFIADAPGNSSGPFPVAGWVEVGQAEAFGTLGIEWDMTDITSVQDDVVQSAKGLRRHVDMQIILGNDPLDPGQALLWTAARSRDSYPFRLTFPDGATIRQWFALVTRLGEVFDAANEVMRLQVDLKPTSDIQRSEVTP